MQHNDIIDIISQFKKKSQQRYSILRIGVFGSCARNNMTPESDIDIVVFLSDQDLFNVIGIKQDLEEDLEMSVDIVSYREKMNPHLKRRIDREAIYV